MTGHQLGGILCFLRTLGFLFGLTDVRPELSASWPVTCTSTGRLASLLAVSLFLCSPGRMQVHERRAVNLISCVLLNRRLRVLTPAWRMYCMDPMCISFIFVLFSLPLHLLAAWPNIQPPACTTLPTPQMLGQGARAKR